MARPDRLAKSVVAACMELHRRRCWTRVPPDAPFLIRVPGEEEALAGVLIGQDGEELGLVLVPGPDAFERMRDSILEGGPTDAAADGCGWLSVTFDRLGAIPPEQRGVLEAAGFHARRESIAPVIFSKPPHRQIQRPSRGELRTLAWCLAGIFAAEDRGELQLTTYRGDKQQKLLEIEVRGELNAPEVTTALRARPARRAVAGAGPVLLPADLAERPRSDACWIAGLALVPGRVEGDARTMHSLLVLDEGSEKILSADVVPGGDLHAAVDSLCRTLRKHGLPRRIVFTSEPLMDCMASGLAALEVASELDREEPSWWKVASELSAAMENATEMPATEPQSLEEWKQAERAFTIQFVGEILQRDLITPRAGQRYFGDEETAARLQQELEELPVMPAFIEWLAADYRPTTRSRTHVEKLLEQKRLGPVERALLEARRDAYLSFFRVDSCTPGASIEVEDILNGRRFTVQDRGLSSSAIEGWHLPMRLLRIGDWHFASVAGPPLGKLQIDRVLSWLEASGMTLEPEAMRADAHLLGRTWAWFLEERSRPVQLRNTDDDPLEWHTAEFHVADPGALVSALEERGDVGVDDPGAEWTWFREGGPAGVGSTTALCRLQLIDDALLAEANSARRIDKARAWIEALPGVRFVGMRRSDPDDEGARPLDDRLPDPPPAPISPEMRAELERFLEEHALRWIDEPVPALGELTPRAACATPEGRRRVARLIRTMPAMRIPGGEIPAPRERILRELGL